MVVCIEPGGRISVSGFLDEGFAGVGEPGIEGGGEEAEVKV